MRKVLALLAALCLADCASEHTDLDAFVTASTLTEAVDRAAAHYHVPREILLAVAWVEGRWTDPGVPPNDDRERPSDHDAHGGIEIGPMHLRHGAGLDSLRRAQELLHIDETTLRSHLGLQVAGAAAVLSELGRQTGATETDVDSWAEAVARYSGIQGRVPQIDYARQVWEVLRQGRRETAFTGEQIFLPGRHGPDIEQLLQVDQAAQFSADYPPARWVPAYSGNYGGLRGRDPQYVVVHDTEGSYAGTISWFQNPMAGVATHYVIRSSDGEVTQMVRDAYIAWHVANTYYNTNAIGIEHEGYYTAPERWFTEAMYVSSARLVRHLCDRYGIPIDRNHIFGHYQVYRRGDSTLCTDSWDTCRRLTGNHVDPGPGWNWDHYMALIRGGGTVMPMYDATLVNVSYPRDMMSGERAVAYVEYRNTGTASWDTTNTRLGTTQPRDHEGRFYDMINWISRNRPTAVDRTTAPGSIGRFSFVIRAPTVTTDTTVTESYGLVQEGVAWFGPPDDAVTFTVRVHPLPTTDAGTSDTGTSRDAAPADTSTPALDASTRDVNTTLDASSAHTDAGRDAMAMDAGRRGTPTGGCGCTTAGAKRTDTVVLAFAGIGLLALRRRRQM